jgi:hypothetical protein
VVGQERPRHPEGGAAALEEVGVLLDRGAGPGEDQVVAAALGGEEVVGDGGLVVPFRLARSVARAVGVGSRGGCAGVGCAVAAELQAQLPVVATAVAVYDLHLRAVAGAEELRGGGEVAERR